MIRAGTLRYNGVIYRNLDASRNHQTILSGYTIGDSSEIEADNIPWYKVSATNYISGPQIFASYNQMVQIIKNMNDKGVVIDGTRFYVRLIQDYSDKGPESMLKVSEESDDIKLLRQAISFRSLKEMTNIGTGTLASLDQNFVVSRGGPFYDESAKVINQGDEVYRYLSYSYNKDYHLRYMLVLEQR